MVNQQAQLLPPEQRLQLEILKQLKILTMDPEYWELIPIDIQVMQTLPANTERVLLDKRERGKLIAIGVLVTSDQVWLEIYVDKMRISGTPQEVYGAGLVGYNSSTFWVSRYDMTNNLYQIWLTPSPWYDYFGRIMFRVKAPSTDVKYTYSIYRYRLKEEKLKTL